MSVTLRQKMKWIVSSIALLLFILPATGQSADGIGTTIILVRHAEKIDQGEDPDLSPAGRERAHKLSGMLSEAGIQALFATQFKRTQQTLMPLAEATHLEIQVRSAYRTDELVRTILESYPGQTVAVASHSDRVTEIIEALGGRPVGILPEQEYDNLFIVTVLGDSRAAVVRLKF